MNKFIAKIIKFSFTDKNYFTVIFSTLLFASSLALILAYISQYFFDYQPCILCLYQRFPFFGIMFLSLFALIFKKKLLAKKIIFNICIFALVINFFIAFYHSGVEKKIFKEYSGCSAETSSPIYNLSQLREILANTKSVKCDEPKLFIIGLTMAQWNFIYCLLLLIFITLYYFLLKNNKYKNL